MSGIWWRLWPGATGAPPPPPPPPPPGGGGGGGGGGGAGAPRAAPPRPAPPRRARPTPPLPPPHLPHLLGGARPRVGRAEGEGLGHQPLPGDLREPLGHRPEAGLQRGVARLDALGDEELAEGLLVPH